MDVNFINPFLVSTKEVFDTMVHLPITLGKPYLRRDTESKYDVSTAIGISGAVTGSAILSFPQDVAVAVASGLAGSPFKNLDQDCIDALGEVANMIAGSAKGRLPGGQNKLSLPNVVLGQHRVAMPSGVPIIVIPCEVQIPSERRPVVKNFIIEIAFRAASTAAAPASAKPEIVSGAA
jgi:chemotaxis protein CheX